MLKKNIIILISTFVLYHISYAQNYTISGKILDAVDNTPLLGVSVSLIQIPDTTKKTNTISKSDGTYKIDGLSDGLYIVKCTYLGYSNSIKRVKIIDKNELLNIFLNAKTQNIQDVNIDAKQLRTEQKGDTIQYNASAYKTHRDATVEDLVTKMPGVSNENGVVKAQGEQVQKVLLDGKEFFGDDPSMALKNLPAELVDKIQVFDRLNDQSRFTGVDDGNAQKTINITSKRGKTEGQFGKFYAGIGYFNKPMDIYNSGINYNYFKGERRISVLGFSNNINQQNFSMQDLMGVMGGGQGGGGNRGGGGGMMRNMGGNMPAGSSNYMLQNSGLGNFIVNQQSGIATSHAIGVNYTDEWSKKIKVTGSYFFNQINNEATSSLHRKYFNNKDSGLVYTEESKSSSTNTNNRANFRFEYNADTNNAIIITPRLSIQNYNSNARTDGNNNIGGFKNISNTKNNVTSENMGYSFKNEVLYRHKFLKYGRTIAFTYGTDINDKWGYTTLLSNSNFNNGSNPEIKLDNKQYANQNTYGYTHSGNISYTEPFGKYSQVQLSYSPSYNYNITDKTTTNFNPIDNKYNIQNDTLSNKYNFEYTVQKAGISYVLNYTNTNFTATLNAQQSNLNGSQQYPVSYSVKRYFENILPQIQYNYKFSSATNLRVNYRTSANAPSITQLQSVVNNSNPVLLTTGNQNLLQDYSHFAIARFGHSNTAKGTSIFFFINGQLTQDYIANQTFLPTKDSIIDGGITLRKNAQLTRPVNMNGYWNARAYFIYGFPIKTIKSNININLGVSYSRTPGKINDAINYANTYNLNQGITISSNISPKLDFNINYNSTYNIVENTIQKGANNNYFNHTAAIKVNYVLLKKIVLNTNITQTLYTGLNQGYNQNFLLCNASIAYKFMKNEAMEAKLSVYDLLNQNTNVNRNVTETYVEDTRSNILKQYFMITLTYSLRKFKL